MFLLLLLLSLADALSAVNHHELHFGKDFHTHSVLSALEKFHFLPSEVHSPANLRRLSAAPSFSLTLHNHSFSFNDLENYFSYSGQTSLPHIQVEGNVSKTQDLPLDCIFRAKDSVLSFCNDELRGFVRINDTKIHLQPVLYSGRSLVAVYYAEDAISAQNDTSCGVRDEVEIESHTMSQVNHVLQRKERRLEDQFIEILMVSDNKRSDDYTVAVFAHTLYFFTLVNELYSEFGGGDAILLRVTGVVSFSSGDPYSTADILEGNLITVDSDDSTDGLLRLFNRYIESQDSGSSNQDGFAGADGSALEFDLAHLISGHEFRTIEGSTSVVGLATVSGACTTSKTGVTQELPLEANTATVIAHELGHGLGFRHTDNTELNCASDVFDYIMDSSGTTGRSWSSCSVTWWQRFLSNNPTCFEEEFIPVNEAYCGNGVVDEGEECDCGLLDCSETLPNGLIADPCCDGSTCRYVEDAVCGRNDACCDVDSCQVFSIAPLPTCRSKRDSSSCDTEEVCDGVNKQCPEDVQEVYGTECDIEGFDGHCFRGLCISSDQQCSPRVECNSIQTDNEGDTFCSRTNDRGLLCANSCPSTQGSILTPEDGTLCDDDSGCYKGSCVLYSQIPVLDECLNNVLDGGETDIDCGGADCLPCTSGRNCVEDADCFGTCNVTESVGVCVGVDSTELEDLFDLISEWVEENTVLFAFLIVLSVIIVAVVARKSLKETKQQQQERQRAYQQRESYRQSRGFGSSRNSDRVSRNLRDQSVNANRNSQRLHTSQRVTSSSAQRLRESRNMRSAQQSSVSQLQLPVADIVDTPDLGRHL